MCRPCCPPPPLLPPPALTPDPRLWRAPTPASPPARHATACARRCMNARASASVCAPCVRTRPVRVAQARARSRMRACTPAHAAAANPCSFPLPPHIVRPPPPSHLFRAQSERKKIRPNTWPYLFDPRFRPGKWARNGSPDCAAAKGPPRCLFFGDRPNSVLALIRGLQRSLSPLFKLCFGRLFPKIF